MTSRLDEALHLLAAGARDRTAFQILRRDADSPAEIMLFLAQQAAEKSIKAVLCIQGLTYRRTHDLSELHALAAANGIAIPVARELLMRLGPYAVEHRYLSVGAPDVALGDAATAIESLLNWAKVHVDTIQP
jgi:HEPN domain-containing protein